MTGAMVFVLQTPTGLLRLHLTRPNNCDLICSSSPSRHPLDPRRLALSMRPPFPSSLSLYPSVSTRMCSNTASVQYRKQNQMAVSAHGDISDCQPSRP